MSLLIKRDYIDPVHFEKFENSLYDQGYSMLSDSENLTIYKSDTRSFFVPSVSTFAGLFNKIYIYKNENAVMFEVSKLILFPIIFIIGIGVYLTELSVFEAFIYYCGISLIWMTIIIMIHLILIRFLLPQKL